MKSGIKWRRQELIAFLWKLIKSALYFYYYHCAYGKVTKICLLLTVEEIESNNDLLLACPLNGGNRSLTIPYGISIHFHSSVNCWTLHWILELPHHDWLHCWYVVIRNKFMVLLTQRSKNQESWDLSCHKQWIRHTIELMVIIVVTVQHHNTNPICNVLSCQILLAHSFLCINNFCWVPITYSIGISE